MPFLYIPIKHTLHKSLPMNIHARNHISRVLQKKYLLMNIHAKNQISRAIIKDIFTYEYTRQ